MSNMNVEEFIREQILTYERILALKDPKRFWYQNRKDQVYLFDCLSGNIYTLKGNSARLFQAKEREEFEKILSTLTCDEMKSVYTIVDKILKFTGNLVQETKFTMNSIHLDLSNRCNLACKYCFKDKRRFELTDWSIVTRALEFLVYECGKEASEYEIGYCYTSEPLLDFQNLKKLIIETTQLSKKIDKKISVFFTTNGTILTDEILRYFNRISRQMNISIDGPQNVHDTVRRFANEAGTFSVIQKNIKKLKENNYTLLASSVLTTKYPYPVQILNFLLDQGFVDILIKPARLGNELSFNEKNLGELKNGYEEYFQLFYEDLKEGSFERIKRYMNDFPLRGLKIILLKQKKPRRCYWGWNKMSINHRGEIFPCDSALNINDFKVGDVYTGMDWSRISHLLHVEARGDCKSCWARYICGGTCYIDSWLNNRDYLSIDPVECELNKFLAESCLNLTFQLLDEGFDLEQLRKLYSARPLR